MNTHYLMTFNVPPALEGMVVDYLLTLETTQGFSSFPVFAHHHENKGLSLAEQVTGRQKKVRFQLSVNADNLPTLLNDFKANFVNTGIHYWIAPIIEQGSL